MFSSLLLISLVKVINQNNSMCVKPISIKNPGFARSHYGSELGSIVEVSSHLYPSKEYIEVPCGNCSECRATYLNSLLQRALCESLSSYMYFITLTYDDKHIPSIVLPNGKRVFYSNYKDIQLLFKRFRDANILDRDFRYLSVNEYGDSYSRPHFHLLIFVAKLDSDNKTTPFFIEKQLFDNILPLYAINVGTRKNPKYEPLLTYRSRLRYGKLYTNYFVKYVCPNVANTDLSILSDSYVKTIRYLIGYVNQGSYFDDTIKSYISEYKYNTLLFRKLSTLLRSHVRFSKGFGCGFVNGIKHYLPRISLKSSSNTLYYSQLISTLPSTWTEFCDMYPHESSNFNNWLNLDKYKGFDTLSSCLRSFDAVDYFYHTVYVLYFNSEFSAMYRNRFSCVQPYTIIYQYYILHNSYSYKLPTISTSAPIQSSLFDYLRQGIEEGITSKFPCIAFKIPSTQQFTALCKYYRERVSFFDDVSRLYDALGVSNYDEWLHLFIKYNNNRKTAISQGNKLKYVKNDENILKVQKHSLYLHRETSQDELIRYLTC